MKTPFQKMVTKLKKPGTAIFKSLSPELASTAHMLTGVYDETLELGHEVEEEVFGSGGSIEKATTRRNIRLEAGDLLFYLEGLHQDLLGKSMDAERCVSALLEYTTQETSPAAMMRELRSCIVDLATPIKRHIYYSKGLDLTEVSFNTYRVMGVLVALLQHYGESLESCEDANQQKLLGERYSEGKYSDEQANTRADEK